MASDRTAARRAPQHPLRTDNDIREPSRMETRELIGAIQKSASEDQKTNGEGEQMPTKGSTKSSKKIRDVMTTNPVCVDAQTTVMDAARQMRAEDIGDVLIQDGGGVCIMTDRDVVVRVIAEGRDPASTLVRDACTTDIATVSPDTTITAAIGLMRDKAVRRIPVVEDGRPVGIVSLGDLAERQDPKSALADISAAPPNN